MCEFCSLVFCNETQRCFFCQIRVEVESTIIALKVASEKLFNSIIYYFKLHPGKGRQSGGERRGGEGLTTGSVRSNIYTLLLSAKVQAHILGAGVLVTAHFYKNYSSSYCRRYLQGGSRFIYYISRKIQTN